MRIFALFIMVSFLLVLPIFAQNKQCEIALPRYGTIECFNSGQRESQSLEFISSDTQTISKPFTCLSNCEINENDLSFSCDSLQAKHWEIYLDGSSTPIVVRSINLMENKGVLPYSFERPHSITIKAWCRGADIWTTHPVKNPSVSVKQDKIVLREAWASSLEYITISGTEGCTLNKVTDKLNELKNIDTVPISSWIDPITGQKKSQNFGTFKSPSEFPSNWEIGQNYIFVKEWGTNVADISLTYDKQNKPYWCGGLFGSRKIYSVKEITSVTGSCYAIPQDIVLQNIQCCFPLDCIVIDPSGKLTCNPDTWKCEETKSCNSDLECQQTFTSGICQNKQMTSWTCDTTKKWGNYAGTCVKQTKSVLQCPDECTSNEYYNDVEGKCKPRVTLLDCPPAGKCCKAGGSYKEKSCDASLQCCLTANPIIGECKESCAPTQIANKEAKAGNKSQIPPIQTDILDPTPVLVIVAIVAIILGGLGGYMYYTKRVKSPKAPLKTSAIKNYCTNCGVSNPKGNKFCTNCGEGL